MIENVKNKIIFEKGKEHTFRFNGARNQVEEFNGIINAVYNYIFTIKTTNNIIKSFSYNDVLIGNLEFI